MNPIHMWRELRDEERNQVILVSLITMFFSTVILYGFLVSRGRDVDFFKDRLTLMEQRINYMDQKLDKINETNADAKRDLAELRRLHEQQQREMEDNRRWLEHWKNLPQLPKPPVRR